MTPFYGNIIRNVKQFVIVQRIGLSELLQHYLQVKKIITFSGN